MMYTLDRLGNTVLIALYGLIALYQVSDLIVRVHDKRRGTPIPASPVTCAEVFCGVLAAWCVFSWRSIHPIIYVEMFSVGICGILHWKLLDEGKIADVIDRVFSFFEVGQPYAEKLYRFTQRCLWLPLLGLIGLALLGRDARVQYVALLLMLFWVYIAGMHSCRKLLCFWGLYGAVFSLVTWLHLEELATKPIDEFAILLWLLMLLVWIVSIGFVDDDVGRLAMLLINTATTILLLLVSVFSAFRGGFTADFLTEQEWQQLQFVALCGLLPFVVSGYLAAAFKEAQIYWCKKRSASRRP